MSIHKDSGLGRVSQGCLLLRVLSWHSSAGSFAAALPPQLTLVLPFALVWNAVKGNPCPLQAKQVLLHYALPPVYLKLQPLLISCCVAGDEACLSGAWRQGAGMDHPRAQLSVRATQPTRAAFGVQTPHWPIQVKARCCLAGANRASPRRHASAGPATTAAAI